MYLQKVNEANGRFWRKAAVAQLAFFAEYQKSRPFVLAEVHGWAPLSSCNGAWSVKRPRHLTCTVNKRSARRAESALSHSHDTGGKRHDRQVNGKALKTEALAGET